MVPKGNSPSPESLTLHAFISSLPAATTKRNKSIGKEPGCLYVHLPLCPIVFGQHVNMSGCVLRCALEETLNSFPRFPLLLWIIAGSSKTVPFMKGLLVSQKDLKRSKQQLILYIGWIQLVTCLELGGNAKGIGKSIPFWQEENIKKEQGVSILYVYV